MVHCMINFSCINHMEGYHMCLLFNKVSIKRLITYWNVYGRVKECALSIELTNST